MSAAAQPRTTMPHLDRVLAMTRRRMRVNRALSVGGPALLAAAVALAAWVAAARFAPLSRPGAIAAGTLVAVALVIAVAAAVVRIPDRWAAWAADRWLRQPETFATALELRGAWVEQTRGGPTATELRPTADGGLAGEHLRRAEAAAEAIHRLPDRPRVPARVLAAATAVVLVAAGIAALGDPQRAARERIAQERAATGEQADALRAAAEEQRRSGRPADRAAAERLERLADRLEGTDIETALERLQAEQAALAERMIGDLAAQRTALAGLERALERQPLATGDSAADQLEQLAAELSADDVDAARREEIGERLEELAEALAGQPEVAGELGRAGSALRSGSPNAAGAVRAAAGATAEAGRQLAEGEANAAAAGAVTSAADALRDRQSADGDSSATSPGQQGQGQGQGQNGQGQGQNGQAQGQGGQGGQGGAQGGQGARASGQQRDGSSAARGSPGDQAPRTQPSGDLDTQTVYDPRRAEASGQNLQIQGRDTGDEPETTKGTSQGAGQRNAALVPYQEVLTDYAQRATQTVERPGYPARLRDTVRTYFDGLAAPE
jgi:hypothetical protein